MHKTDSTAGRILFGGEPSERRPHRNRQSCTGQPDGTGTSISVETLNGTVMLSGFAKSQLERNTAGQIARNLTGVKAVKNEIVVRP